MITVIFAENSRAAIRKKIDMLQSLKRSRVREGEVTDRREQERPDT